MQTCAYCERPEAYLGGEEAFEVEHFRPKAQFKDLIFAYPNLYYACRGCNSHKSNTWPSEIQLAFGLRFADPCEEDLFVQHLREEEDGALTDLTACGSYSKAHIRLDRDDLKRWRRLRSKFRRDLPGLTAIARGLEELLNAPAGFDRERIEQELDVLRRWIEESKLRFSV